MDVSTIKKSSANPAAKGNIRKIMSGAGIKILLSFAIMGLLAVMPPVVPLSAVGMDVLGVFIGTVLLLSLVDTTWPAILSIALFSMTGVMPLEDIIAASFGNWITMFVIMGFVLTYALNHSGFTGRLTAFFLSSKIAKRSPWSFTVVLICLSFLVASFMEPSATIVSFLGFARKIFESLDYKKTDRYPSDISRKECAEIRTELDGARKKTHPGKYDLYDVFCAVLYMAQGGIQWQMLSSDYSK